MDEKVRFGSTGSRQDYRPDIDGLRAVAVLAVIVFHYFPTGCRAASSASTYYRPS